MVVLTLFTVVGDARARRLAFEKSALGLSREGRFEREAPLRTITRTASLISSSFLLLVNHYCVLLIP